MMKAISLLLFSIFLLLGCTADDDRNNEYSPYLPEEEGNYGLYIVTDSEEDEINFEVLQEHGITNVSHFSGTNSMENVALSEIDEMPYYLVFDTEGKVYETNDSAELFEFLREQDD